MRTEILANFTESSAEPWGTLERAEAAYRIVALFEATMILLNAVVQVLTGTVQHFAAQTAMNSPPTGTSPAPRFEATPNNEVWITTDKERFSSGLCHAVKTQPNRVEQHLYWESLLVKMKLTSFHTTDIQHIMQETL